MALIARVMSKVLIDRVFANQAPTNQITPNEISLSAVQLLEQGVDLMLYGLGAVFIFLALLVTAITLISFVIRKFWSDNGAVEILPEQSVPPLKIRSGDTLLKILQNALINTVTIFLGLGVGSKMSADKFLNAETLGILLLGVLAFCIGTASGVLMAKMMNKLGKHPINPLIGSAGVSAVPMAARVSNRMGLEANPHNHLLMHAMGPNVAGVIGSAVAAGVMISLVGG